MKKHLITLLAALSCVAVASAKGSVKGSVKEKESGEPVEFANVQLLDAKGNPLPIGTQTDLEGNFIIVDVPDGKYTVRISNVGSVTQERPVTVSNGTVTIGTVTLAEDTKMLKEVVVTGIASQMKFELDRKVFSVDASIASSGASASEVLESIPSVEVDQDGGISLRGNDSVTVWINGKESGLTSDNQASILEQLPAETIERVEVITNPSAKYSPEGSAGIINIVLKKDARAGYFGSAEIGANSRGGGNVNLNINYNTKHWETYASVGFRMRHNKGGSESRRTYTDKDWFLNSTGENPNHGNNIFLRAGATYNATDHDAIYLNAFGMFGHRWGRSITDYESNIPGSWIFNHSETRNSNDMRGAHAELGYTHKWTDLHSLDMMIAYNHWSGLMNNYYIQEMQYEEPDPDTNLYQSQENDMQNNGIEAKIDYTKDLTSWLKLEAGYNGNYSHENSPVTTYQGSTPTDMVLYPALYNRFIYDNNITAFYATLGGKYKDFSFQAGLRAEAWQVRAQSLAYGQTRDEVDPYKKNSFALFPSAFLSWSLPHGNEMQINYTRRIRRPWGGQLNPFQNISDPTNISYGNQELQPEYTNAFELNYIKSFTNHIISFSGYLRTTNDVMNRISYLVGDVMYTTTDNVTNRTDAGAEIVVKNGLFNNILNLTTTVNLYNSHLSAWNKEFIHDDITYELSGQKQNSFAWNLSCMASVRLPWDISFQATGRYNSRQITAQGSREAGWNIDAGLRKNVGNWSFAINCRDIFDSRKFHNIVNGVDYVQDNKRWRGGRTLRLTVKYSFGNMKAKRNKNNSGGDMMEGGGAGYGEMGDM